MKVYRGILLEGYVWTAWYEQYGLVVWTTVTTTEKWREERNGWGHFGAIGLFGTASSQWQNSGVVSGDVRVNIVTVWIRWWPAVSVGGDWRRPNNKRPTYRGIFGIVGWSFRFCLRLLVMASTPEQVVSAGAFLIGQQDCDVAQFPQLYQLDQHRWRCSIAV
jgi:hypothetical protein